MLNKPKYNLLKNTLYAYNGLKDLIKNETSFKIEIIVFIILIIFIIIIKSSIIEKLLMFMSIFFVLIAETINSAIERIVDLITQDYNELAGKAKDIGSTIVFFSIIMSFIIWGTICFSL